MLLNKKRFLKKLCTVLLCLVLCFTLVVNTCVDSFAIAGVDDGLFFLLLAILTASGITFLSVENAHAGTDAFYNNCSPNLQKWLDSKAMEITAFAAGVSSIGITCSKYWSDVIDAIAKTFGDYTGIDVHLNIDSPGKLKLGGDAFKFSVPGVGPSNAVSVAIGNVTMQYIGGHSAAIDSIKPLIASRHLSFSEDHVYILMSTQIAGLKFLCDLGRFSSLGTSVTFNDSFSLYTSSTVYPYPVISSTVFVFDSGGENFINGLLDGKWFRISNEVREACTFTLNYVDESDIYNSVGANIVVGNKLGDYTLSDSICPDGIWTRKSYADWLNDLIFGEGAGAAASDIPSVGALPGNPGIDTTAYPGNDTWHDDVATGNPSIGISVPTDVSDETITDYTRDVARDIASADKVLDDTSTDDKDKPGDKDDKKPSSKPGGLPTLTLPEILFKTKFPFCLPWDLYNVFVLLNAEPVAPKFDIPFKFDRLGIDYTFSIDLSEYEQLALISRVSLSVMFIIALILLSRKVIGAE